MPLSEKLNAISHAIGVLLLLVAIPFLWRRMGDADIKVVSAVVLFCCTILVMYLSSVYYHLAIHKDVKRRWRTIDHIAIYGLIGGTYTPFIALYYNGENGLIFLSVLWTLILLASVFKLFYTGRFRLVSTMIYLLLGWMVVIIYEPVTLHMSELVFDFLALGGVFYTIGTIFYLRKSFPFHHAVWHLFVLAGTSFHFLSVYFSL